MIIFIWDVPIIILLGFFFAFAHAKIFVDKHPDFHVHIGFVTIMVFWINAAFAFFGADPWGAECAIRIVPKAIAVPFTLSYPFWLIWGGTRAFHLFGRSPRQGGFLWIFSLKDRTKPFKKWDGSSG